jgi:hypothetical protein
MTWIPWLVYASLFAHERNATHRAKSGHGVREQDERLGAGRGKRLDAGGRRTLVSPAREAEQRASPSARAGPAKPMEKLQFQADDVVLWMTRRVDASWRVESEFPLFEKLCPIVPWPLLASGRTLML